MIYTNFQILRELRLKIIKQEKKYDIACWAYERFLKLIKNLDHELEKFLIDLSCMQEGLEYELSYDQLEDMLDKFFMGDDFVYDRLEFAKELRQKIRKKESVEQIGAWAYSIYLDYMSNIDQDFERFLLCLGAMEEGEQFARSYEELEDIANRLIAGEDVKL